jgi:hydroxymethylglutaryl-CoA lyase
MGNKLQLVECPRDAMQGWKRIIPTQQKIAYLNALLKIGFHTLDFGSFVSAKAIPQMSDTKEVIPELEVHNSKTRLLAIVANSRGAAEACTFDEISFLGFPFSVSPTFQHRNTNSSIEESLLTVEAIQDLCLHNNKKAVIYISMGFGNPYKDVYSTDIVLKWIERLVDLGIETISLSDTVGVAEQSQITSLLNTLIPAYPTVEIGIHLHSAASTWQAKIDAALKSGCKRFDGALRGIGGCPMADDELVGNIDTALMIPYFEQLELLEGIDKDALTEALLLADEIFR